MRKETILRINIARTSVDANYLLEQAEHFGDREALMPYIIMSQKTINVLMEVCGDSIKVGDDGGYHLNDYRILINPSLGFGDVDIR